MTEKRKKIKEIEQDILDHIPEVKEIRDVQTFLNQPGKMMVIKGRIVFVEDETQDDVQEKKGTD